MISLMIGLFWYIMTKYFIKKIRASTSYTHIRWGGFAEINGRITLIGASASYKELRMDWPSRLEWPVQPDWDVDGGKFWVNFGFEIIK